MRPSCKTTLLQIYPGWDKVPPSLLLNLVVALAVGMDFPHFLTLVLDNRLCFWPMTNEKHLVDSSHISITMSPVSPVKILKKPNRRFSYSLTVGFVCLLRSYQYGSSAHLAFPDSSHLCWWWWRRWWCRTPAGPLSTRGQLFQQSGCMIHCGSWTDGFHQWHWRQLQMHGQIAAIGTLFLARPRFLHETADIQKTRGCVTC